MDMHAALVDWCSIVCIMTHRSIRYFHIPMASRFNIYSDLVISRNELEISKIQLLISPIHLVIPAIHLMISAIELLIYNSFSDISNSENCRYH